MAKAKTKPENAITFKLLDNDFGSIEESIFNAVRVRVVIRIHPQEQIPSAAAKKLSAELSMDQTVAVWKETLSRNLLIPQHRLMITILKPDGGIADGRYLVRNVAFPKP